MVSSCRLAGIPLTPTGRLLSFRIAALWQPCHSTHQGAQCSFADWPDARTCHCIIQECQISGFSEYTQSAVIHALETDTRQQCCRRPCHSTHQGAQCSFADWPDARTCHCIIQECQISGFSEYTQSAVIHALETDKHQQCCRRPCHSTHQGAQCSFADWPDARTCHCIIQECKISGFSEYTQSAVIHALETDKHQQCCRRPCHSTHQGAQCSFADWPDARTCHCIIQGCKISGFSEYTQSAVIHALETDTRQQCCRRPCHSTHQGAQCSFADWPDARTCHCIIQECKISGFSEYTQSAVIHALETDKHQQCCRRPCQSTHQGAQCSFADWPDARTCHCIIQECKISGFSEYTQSAVIHALETDKHQQCCRRPCHSTHQGAQCSFADWPDARATCRVLGEYNLQCYGDCTACVL